MVWHLNLPRRQTLVTGFSVNIPVRNHFESLFELPTASKQRHVPYITRFRIGSAFIGSRKFSFDNFQFGDGGKGPAMLFTEGHEF